MKIKLIKETRIGSRMRPVGQVMDVTLEKAQEMMDAGEAVAADVPVKKKRKNV
jgi:hypothetical protein